METNTQKPMSQQTLQQSVLAKQKPDSKYNKQASQQADQNITKRPSQQPWSLRLPKGPAAGAKP